jgi:hypothetical protein
MLEALRTQEWTLMRYSVVKAALEDQDYILCPEHKTAEVARIAEQSKETPVTSGSSQDQRLEWSFETEDSKAYLHRAGVRIETIVATTRSMAISPSTWLQVSKQPSSATCACPGHQHQAPDLIHECHHDQYIYMYIYISWTPTCKAPCNLVNLTPIISMAPVQATIGCSCQRLRALMGRRWSASRSATTSPSSRSASSPPVG